MPTCVGNCVGGPLVQVAGVVVVAVAIVFQRQAEQGAGVVAVGGDGPLQAARPLRSDCRPVAETVAAR